MKFGWIICRFQRRHKEAVFEFTGCKPDLSTPDGCIKGIPVYRVSCPRCGISFLYGEDELAQDIIKALETGNPFKGGKIIQYTSGYQPE